MTLEPRGIPPTCECGASSWIPRGGRLLCRACGAYIPNPLSPYRKELAERVEAGISFASPCEECYWIPEGSGEIYPNCKKFNCVDLAAFRKAAIELNCEKIRTAFRRRGLYPKEPVEQFLDKDGCIIMYSLPHDVRVQVELRKGDEGLVVMLPPRQRAHQASRRELLVEAKLREKAAFSSAVLATQRPKQFEPDLRVTAYNGPEKPFNKVSAVAEEVASEEKKDV